MNRNCHQENRVLIAAQGIAPPYSGEHFAMNMPLCSEYLTL
jgi:hypothetical protein